MKPSDRLSDRERERVIKLRHCENVNTNLASCVRKAVLMVSFSVPCYQRTVCSCFHAINFFAHVPVTVFLVHFADIEYFTAVTNAPL